MAALQHTPAAAAAVAAALLYQQQGYQQKQQQQGVQLRLQQAIFGERHVP